MTAAKKLALATYKYNDLDQGVKELERRYIPDELRKRAVFIGIWIDFVLDKRLSYRWEF